MTTKPDVYDTCFIRTVDGVPRSSSSHRAHFAEGFAVAMASLEPFMSSSSRRASGGDLRGTFRYWFSSARVVR